MRMTDRLAGWLGYERRAAQSEASWGMLGYGGAVTRYSERQAENVASVAACVGAVASALSSVPVYVYRRGSNWRREIIDHSIARLFQGSPNALQSAPDLLEGWIASTLLTGNGLLHVLRDGAEVSGLRFIPWGWVTPALGPSGRLIYDVSEPGVFGNPGRAYRLLADDVAHLKDRSDDGVIGVSRLRRSQEAVAHAHGINRRANAVVANGAAPSGALVSERDMTSEQMERLRESVERGHTGQNAGRVMLLTGGVDFKPFEITPEDAELLASRRFSVEEICRLYQVPPPLIQDYSHNTFTNSETAGRWFAQFTLGPWVRKIEAVLSRALFPDGSGLEVELDLSAFLRGDPQTRWQAHKIAVETGILTADEVREIEGFNPRGKAVVA